MSSLKAIKDLEAKEREIDKNASQEIFNNYF